MVNTSGGNQLLDPQRLLIEVGVQKNQQVADLGCGAVGHFVFPAAEMVGDKGLVYAVDIRRIILEGIKNRARIEGKENIKTVWSNLEVYRGTGILDNSLDVAMLINVLFQNKKQEEIIHEAVRMVKPGGRLAIVDWKPEKSVLGPPLEIRAKPEVLIKLCQKEGLTVEREFEPGNFHFGLLFNKKK
jgi:ubiquinone/menaquinone biosynthesis C-methylase UbiE